MSWVKIGIPLVAAWLFGFAERPVLAWSSVAVAVAALWAFRTMHGYAVASARKRRAELVEDLRREGKLREGADPADSAPVRITREDTRAAPGWLANLDVMATVAGVILLAWALIT